MLTLGAILLCLGAGCAMIGAAYLFAVWMASLADGRPDQPSRDNAAAGRSGGSLDDLEISHSANFTTGAQRDHA